MRHEDVWRALDTLAAEKGLSPSGLARAAGLDPTSFNRSKRVGRGKLRWPSTESLSRVLAATGATLESFAALVGGARVLSVARGQRGRPIPLLTLSHLAGTGLFDPSAQPADAATEHVEAPPPAGPHAYAVRIDTDRFEPLFRQGSTLIVSPDAAIRPGDRVLAGFGGTVALCLVRESGGASPALGALAGDAIPEGAATGLHRIVWASL